MLFIIIETLRLFVFVFSFVTSCDSRPPGPQRKHGKTEDIRPNGRASWCQSGSSMT